MLPHPKSFVRSLLLSALALGLASLPAAAATITTTLTPFTGGDAAVQITLDDGADPGNVVVTVEIVATPNIGDLRGVFFHIDDESLLSGLSVINGPDITESVFSANSVINLGGGNNLNGGGSPCPCDIGLEIGDPGMGHGDDFRLTMFTLTHSTQSLSIAQFQSQLAGARVTSVGLEGGSRNDSSKLFTVVPEPSTVALLGIGLGGLALRRSRLAAHAR